MNGQASDSQHSDADTLHASLVQLRHAVLRDGFLQAIRAMDEYDISVAQMATLMLLDAERGGTVGGLATDLGRSLSATSRLIDQLVRRGLVDRQEDDRDRRIKRVALTERGQELIGQVQRQRSEAQLAVMATLSDAERTEVMRGMSLLAEAASRRRAAAQAEAETRPVQAAPVRGPAAEPESAVPIPAASRP